MIPALEELEVYASLDKVSGSSFNEVFWSNTRNDSTGKLKKVILGESYSATGKIGSALFYGLDFDEIDSESWKFYVHEKYQTEIFYRS